MVNSRYLRTSEIARAVGVHPNTVRLYEQWGFLPPIPRSPSGYRRFTDAHLDQMQLARTVMGSTWMGGEIRRSALKIVYLAAAEDLGGALEQAYRFLALIQSERTQAEAAAEFLERWARGAAADATSKPLWIGETAQLLNTTVDSLRNWERNGLIRTPRDPHSGYRLYGAIEIGRLRVIRMLLRSGYSTMAVLRMLLQLDQGQRENLRQVLDTPRPDEDVAYASDRWLTTLAEQEERALQIIGLMEEMIRKRRS